MENPNYISYPPNIWGKGVWKIIFSSFESLTGEILFYFLEEIICKNLPCVECNKHIAEHFDMNPNIFTNGETYCLLFFIDLYNIFYPLDPINKNNVDFSLWVERDKQNNINVTFT